MTRFVVSLVILALALSGADKKKKPPDVTILECKSRRGDGKITFDGKVRNSGVRTIHGLVLLFDFFSSDKELLSTLKGPVEDEVMEIGSESSFHLEADQPPRAVRYQVNAVDQGGRDLRLANPGPFAIE